MATVTERAVSNGKKVPGQRKGDADGDVDGAPRSKKKLVIIVVAALVLLGGGGAAAFLLLGGKPAAEEVVAEPPPVPGEVIALEPITINLAGGRYLQLGLALQTELAEEGGHGGGETDGSHALDLAIETFSGKEMATLSDPAERAHYKEELLHKVEEAYHHHVYDIYFTSFVMQ